MPIIISEIKEIVGTSQVTPTGISKIFNQCSSGCCSVTFPELILRACRGIIGIQLEIDTITHCNIIVGIILQKVFNQFGSGCCSIACPQLILMDTQCGVVTLSFKVQSFVSTGKVLIRGRPTSYNNIFNQFST